MARFNTTAKPQPRPGKPAPEARKPDPQPKPTQTPIITDYASL